MEHKGRECLRKLVAELENKRRLSDFAEEYFPELPSRKSVKKNLQRGNFLLNGKPGQSGDWVCDDDIVELLVPENIPTKLFDFPMPVLFEDEHLAVIHKPSGIGVSGNYFRTVQNALPSFLKPSSLADAMPLMRPVHRLDNRTSGLLLIAKTYSVAKELGLQFENGCVKKQYQAIVCGTVPGSGRILEPIDGKASESSFELLASAQSLRYGTVSWVKLWPHTGRTHQLRIHCSMSGFPIYGDAEYGSEENTVTGKGLFLSAVAIGFKHPSSGKALEFSVEAPEKFKSLFDREQRRYDKFKTVNR